MVECQIKRDTRVDGGLVYIFADRHLSRVRLYIGTVLLLYNILYCISYCVRPKSFVFKYINDTFLKRLKIPRYTGISVGRGHRSPQDMLKLRITGPL